MGSMWSRYVTHPDTTPPFNCAPTFDPLYGFPDGRKERVMIATQEEMDAANLPLDKRDYCAHLYIDLLACQYEAPFHRRRECEPIKHHYHECRFEDHVLRMKEYEREKRLLQRAKRKRLREEKDLLHA